MNQPLFSSIVLVMAWLPTSGANNETVCEDLWRKRRDSCYRYFDTKFTHDEGRVFCWENNAVLITMKNEDDQFWIYAVYGVKQPKWFGLRQNADGEFIWSDGEALSEIQFTNWNKESKELLSDNTPRNGCVSTSTTGEWRYRANCNDKLPILCEIKPIQLPPRCVTNGGRGDCEETCAMEYGWRVCTCTPPQVLHNVTECIPTDSCIIDNGGCEHDCKPKPDESGECSCHSGFNLNGKKCDVSHAMPWFMLTCVSVTIIILCIGMMLYSKHLSAASAAAQAAKASRHYQRHLLHHEQSLVNYGGTYDPYPDEEAKRKSERESNEQKKEEEDHPPDVTDLESIANVDGPMPPALTPARESEG